MWNTLRNAFKTRSVGPDDALPGRDQAIDPGERHPILETPLKPPFPEHLHTLVVGMGCFWGAERCFWTREGVYTTAVGYAGGYTRNPTYEEVCSGQTGHTEVVLVVYDPGQIELEALLQIFWESHDPTQGMRQGNDVGTQYRSAIYVEDDEALTRVSHSLERYQQSLRAAGKGEITTEVSSGQRFYYAEPYHQQYLAKNPGGYCGLGGTGVAY